MIPLKTLGGVFGKSMAEGQMEQGISTRH